MKPQYLKLAAYYHLAGGVLGCVLIMSAVLGDNAYGNTELLVLCGAFLLYSISIYCGYLGLKGRAQQFLRLAFPYQLVQVVMFSFDRVLVYKFFSGLALIIGVPLNDPLVVQFKMNLSAFFVSWNQPTDSFAGVNLVAIALALWMATYLSNEKKHAVS